MKDELERIIIDTANNLHLFDEKKLKNRFFKLKTILSKRALEKFADAINKEYLKTDIGVTAQEIKDNMDEALMNHGMLVSGTNNWIDLDIGNIPSDFFVNECYEIECYEENKREDYYHEWKSHSTNPIARVGIVRHCREGIKYRYRIQENKPIKPIKHIQMTFKMWNTFERSDRHSTLMEREANTEFMAASDWRYYLDGRKVIIID